MGASFLLDAHDMGSCLFFWHKVRMAILMRMRMRMRMWMWMWMWLWMIQ